MSVQWFSTRSISELLEGDFQHKLSFHVHSYCKKCVGAGRGSWKYAFCQSSPGNSDTFLLGHSLEKGITPAQFFLMLGVVALPGLFALMDVFVCISLSVCHWGPVSLGKHCFVHLFVCPRNTDVTRIVLCVFGVISVYQEHLLCACCHTRLSW